MSALVGATLICDTCHRMHDSGFATPAGARSDARRHGWTVAQDGDLLLSDNPRSTDRCPACQPTPETLPGNVHRLTH